VQGLVVGELLAVCSVEEMAAQNDVNPKVWTKI
jgi:hypothetical protein